MEKTRRKTNKVETMYTNKQKKLKTLWPGNKGEKRRTSKERKKTPVAR